MVPLGIVVLIGWYTGNRTLIQIMPAFVPMQFNTALGFVLCGLSLTFWVVDRTHLSRVFGGLAVLVGTLTLVQYVFGVDLGKGPGGANQKSIWNRVTQE